MNPVPVTQQQMSGESDLLGPDELQEVMAANGPLMDCVLNNQDEPFFLGESISANNGMRDGRGHQSMDSRQQEMEDHLIDEKRSNLCNQMPAIDSTMVCGHIHQSTGPLPAREDYPGPYQFSVLLDRNSTSKNKWDYSIPLTKLYIVWNKLLPVQFKWIPIERDLVVRALPVYTDAQDMRAPVLRCLLHSSPDDHTNEGIEHVNHVIRSDNPGAIYEENLESKRCSVVVPLGTMQPGSEGVTVTYKFMCKTTCVTGMMRRPITVLFTLERSNGEVVGRQKLNVKICSCPTRDKKKDEESLMGRMEAAAAGNPVPNRPRRSLSLMEKNLAQHRAAAHSRRQRLALADHNRCPNSRMDMHRDKFTIEIENRDIFKKLMEYLHACVCGLLRTTAPNEEIYGKLIELRNNVEMKLSQLHL